MSMTHRSLSGGADQSVVQPPNGPATFAQDARNEIGDAGDVVNQPLGETGGPDSRIDIAFGQRLARAGAGNQPLQDHHPAFMIGAHDAIPDTLLTNLMSGYRYKSLPATMAGKKLKGLFLQDKLSLIDFSVPSLNLGVMGVSGHASCAVEGRNWVDLSGSLGFGGMAYADVGLSFWLLSPIPDCSSLDLYASAEVLFEAALQGSTFSLTACGSTSVGASICGVSDSFGLTVKGSVNSQGNITLDRIDGSCGQ